MGTQSSRPVQGTIVTVHPWATLGGGEHNTLNLAHHITRSEPKEGSGGWRAITFTLNSTPLTRGGALWGFCSNHSYEVQQIVDVVNYVRDKFDEKNIVLFGSSAGAPQAGSAVAQLLKQQQQQEGEEADNGSIIKAYIAVGYTFGNFAAIGFGRHFPNIVNSSLPKLFVMGDRDEFTSVEQLQEMVEKMRASSAGTRVDIEIVPNVGHFELESPSYDSAIANMTIDWLEEVLR